MRHIDFSRAAALLLAAAGATPAGAECSERIVKLKAEIAAKPERVLILVEDAVVVDESCTCEVVKTAIVAAKADSKLISQIIFTVASVSPQQAVGAGECALAVAPDSADAVKAALKKALGKMPTLSAPKKTETAEKPATSQETASAEPTDEKNPRGKQPVTVPADSSGTPNDGESESGEGESFGGVPQITGPFVTQPSGTRPPAVRPETEVKTRPHRPTRHVSVEVPQPTSTSSDDLTPVD